MAKCIKCQKRVTARQQALACDRCEGWQHRSCDTGTQMNADNTTDITFDISNRNLDQTTRIQEEQVADHSLSTTILPEEPLSFEIIETGSQRKRKLLVDNHGYSYGVKRTAANKSWTEWRCSVRSKTCNCPATVKQIGDTFLPRLEHIHPSERGKHLLADCISESKKDALDHPHKPASQVVEDVLLRNVRPSHVVLPKKDLLIRITNRCRANIRPSEPKDLNFEIDRNFLRCDDFLVEDIRAEDHRHIIFATEQQLRLLSGTKRWFIDGTFKVMNGPWSRQGQLFSIHGFVEIDGNSQQFPLVFVMMSRKTRADYIKVFQCIRDRVQTLSVEGFVADFECAAWLALREVFPGKPIKGCVFHWTQAVWRHIQELGLATTYRQRTGVYHYLKQLFALPFLPSPHIAPAFDHLKTRANTPQLQELVGYIERQWVRGTTFEAASWSVYQQTVRTNNDLEGWHHRLNQKAGPNISFYKLVPLLRREAELVELAIRGGDFSRRSRKKYKDIDAKITSLWQQYANHELTTAAFLRRCGTIYSITESRPLPPAVE